MAAQKLAKTAKKKGYLDRGQSREADANFGTSFKLGGRPLASTTSQPQAVEALLDAVGDDLAAIDDAMERLSLVRRCRVSESTRTR